MESLHKAGVVLALDGLHTGTGPPFRRHGSDDEYRDVYLGVHGPCKESMCNRSNHAGYNASSGRQSGL